MNLDFWGPSHGRIFAPDSFSVYQFPGSNRFWLSIYFRFYLYSANLPPCGPPLTPHVPCFPDFFCHAFPEISDKPWWAASRVFPSFDFVNPSDPAAVAWLASPDSGSWNPLANFQTMWVDSNPLSADRTMAGEIRLMFWEDINLDPLFPMAFTLSWPEYPGLANLPPLVAKPAAKVISTV